MWYIKVNVLLCRIAAQQNLNDVLENVRAFLKATLCSTKSIINEYLIKVNLTPINLFLLMIFTI